MVNEGKGFKNLIIDKDFEFIDTAHETLQSKLIRKWKEKRKEYAIEDIRILVPMRKAGFSGSNTLNELLREYENPKTKTNTIPFLKNNSFRMNDRIMQTKNDYKIVTSSGCGVFNGETGTIVNYDVDNEQVIILLDTGIKAYYNKEDLIDRKSVV